jgi:hypothetical protein
MSKKTKVFALLVGINNYKDAPLNGCVNDAKKIRTYLESRTDLEVSIKELHAPIGVEPTEENEPSKANIIKAFRTYLTKATKDDVVLFYFSGHGAQEIADKEVWKGELDGCLETIACYKKDQSTSLLADKELRYLLHELAETIQKRDGGVPHILTLFDCCHSGDNTRSLAVKELEEEEEPVREKRFNKVFPQREWSDFVFATSTSREQFQQGSLREILPQAAHISMAASQDKQPALEVGNGGLFTGQLLQVLNYSGGLIDYSSLHSLVSNYVRFKYKQVPQLNVQGASTDLLKSGFLNQAVEYEGGLYGLVNYNMGKGWLLNMGQMHGVVEEDPVYFDAEVEKEDDSGEKEVITIKAIIETTYSSYSEIDVDFEIRRRLDKKAFYKAKVEAYNSYPLHIYINDPKGNTVDAIAQSFASINAPIVHVDSETKADYTIQVLNEKVYLTEDFDTYRPVFPPAELSDTDWLDRIKGQLIQNAKWEFAKQLHNNKVKGLAKPPLEISILQKRDGEMETVSTSNNKYIIDAVNWEPENKKHRAYITIRITNNYGFPLFFCMLEMREDRSSDISVETDEDAGLMDKVVKELDPGQTYEVFSHYTGVIPFKVDPDAIRLNKPYSTTWYKFLISTKDDIAYQHLIVPTLRSDLPKKNVADWTTQLVALKLVNPDYDETQKGDETLFA